jgi:hypothetical protein
MASPYAATSFVCAPFDRSRVWLNPKPALQFTCAPNAAASTASDPASMTIANAPLWDRTAESLLLFLPNSEAENFCKGGWTGVSKNCPSGKSADEGSVVERPSLLPPVALRP